MLGSSGGCQSLPLVQPGLHQDLAVQPGAMMAMHPMTALMAMQICILSWWSWNRWWSCSWCWWGRWRCWCSRTDVDSSTLHVFCLQHLRAVALDVATLADFSQSHNRDLSVEVEAFPFQLALEPRNAKSLTLDPGNSPAIVPTGCVTRGTHKELTVISVRLPDILRSLQSSIAWKAAKWSRGRANVSQDFQEVVRTYEGQLYHECYGLETLPTDPLFHELLLAFDPDLKDEIDEYMTKYAPSSSTDDDDGNGDEDDPDAQQDYAAFNAWLDQLSKGEAAPSRPAVSRPPPKDAKPEADAPQVGGSVKSPASGSTVGTCKQKMLELKAKIAARKAALAELLGLVGGLGKEAADLLKQAQDERLRRGSKEDTLDTLPLDLDVIVEDHEPLAVADAKEDGKEDDQREVAEVPLATPQNSFMLSDSFDYDKPTNDGTDPSKAAKKEVLTRQDQLACKKKGKTPTEAEEDPGNTEPGDVEQHKRGTRAPKSNCKGKAKGEAKKKASPKKRGRKPKTEKAGEEKEELKAPKAAPKRKKSEAVEEPVNCNLFHGEEPEEELAEDDPAVEDSDEEPPVMKRPASKRTRTKSAQSTGATHGSDDSDEDVKPKAKANATGKRKAGPKKIPKAESKRKAKAKAKAKSRPQPVENVAAMEDDTMKGVFLQHMKEVKDCTYDDLKEVLNSKKVECKVTKGCLRFNIYWTRCSGAASLCLQPPKWVDAASFAFKAGTWNMRMSIQWMDSVEMEILEAYLDPTGAFQMELAKIKFNAQRAIDELSSKM
ncbi:unnamed protein product [Cladocopium goreaui]|uniref:Uncharacterized protein n=1 Tax=Cladocopium goreaui TaxID=2562237 RepID=A0A9P1GL36_9DINO|nr:unnamed protein product [Cladocopium goreaui]